MPGEVTTQNCINHRDCAHLRTVTPSPQCRRGPPLAGASVLPPRQLQEAELGQQPVSGGPGRERSGWSWEMQSPQTCLRESISPFILGRYVFLFLKFVQKSFLSYLPGTRMWTLIMTGQNKTFENPAQTHWQCHSRGHQGHLLLP